MKKKIRIKYKEIQLKSIKLEHVILNKRKNMYYAINRIKDVIVVIYNDNENVMNCIYHIAHFRAVNTHLKK